MKRRRLRPEMLIGLFLLIAGGLAVATFIIVYTAPRFRTPDLGPERQLSRSIGRPIPDQSEKTVERSLPALPTPMSLDDIGSEIPQLLPQSAVAEGQGGVDPTGSLSRLGLVDTELTQPFRIEIPDLYIDAPVRPVGMEYIEDKDDSYLQWSVPNDYAAGWHESSAPLGEGGNTILNGHNNVHGAIFKDLVDLELGSKIVLHDTSQSYTYEVTERELFEEDGQPLEVRLENARWMLPTSDERITIISCWPVSSNTHRVVVIAHPVENDSS